MITEEEGKDMDSLLKSLVNLKPNIQDCICNVQYLTKQASSKGKNEYYISTLVQKMLHHHPRILDSRSGISGARTVVWPTLLTKDFLALGGFTKIASEYLSKKENEVSSRLNNFSMEVFISHSNQDVQIAKALIDLIRSALNVKGENIRCTSVTGHKLPVGVSTDDQLKKEIFDSKVLIAIISPDSIQSAYVLFELGGRWVTNLPLIPLIGNKLGSELLKGPLQNINALNLCIEGDVFQFVNDLGKYLNLPPEQPSVYQNALKNVVQLALQESLPAVEKQTDKIKVDLSDGFSNYIDAEEKIKQYCEKQWPDDYTMRVHCLKEQKNALEELKKSKPSDISETEFNSIRKKAAKDWPDDFVMRAHAEKEQFNSLRQLKNYNNG